MLPSEAETAQAWKQYDTLCDLYKFYIDQLVKFHTFYFAIAGSLITFVLAHDDDPRIALALLLPLSISLGGVVTFLFGIRKSAELTEAIKAIAARLEMLSAHTEVLQFLCWAFLAVHTLIVLAMLLLLDHQFAVSRLFTGSA